MEVLHLKEVTIYISYFKTSLIWTSVVAYHWVFLPSVSLFHPRFVNLTMFYLSVARGQSLNLLVWHKKAFCHLAIPFSLTFLLSIPSHVFMHQTYSGLSSSSTMSCTLYLPLCVFSLMFDFSLPL